MTRRALLRFDEQGEPALVDRKGRIVQVLPGLYKDGVDLASEAAVKLGLDPLVLLWDFVRPDEVVVKTNWTDAFNKFGFEGGAVTQTDEVAGYLDSLDMMVGIYDLPQYNPVIASIHHPALGELVPRRIEFGHSNPREWLPPWLLNLLDTRYGMGKWQY